MTTRDRQTPQHDDEVGESVIEEIKRRITNPGTAIRTTGHEFKKKHGLPDEDVTPDDDT